MFIQKKFFLPIILLLIFLTSIYSAESAMIGVNRAELNFNDVLRNGYAEQEFIVSIGTQHDVEVFFEARGEIAEWMRFTPEEQGVGVNRDNPLRITAILEPPADARVDNYQGSILVSTGALSEDRGRMGTEVVAAFEIKVNLEITDTQILDCGVGGFNLESAEVGFPLAFSASVNNRGNVRINPVFNFEVYDQSENNVVYEDTYDYDREIFPTAREIVSTGLDWDLAPGQYWVRITESLCEGSTYKTFSVLETGAVRDEGELIRINNEAWTSTREILPITATFRNTGERSVTAQFKGTVSKDDRIVEVLESSTLTVDPGEIVNFEMFYQPSEEGRYSIKGRVQYNNKLTFEKGSVINVRDSDDILRSAQHNFLLIVLIIGVLTIIVLLFLIFKKKRS